MRTLTLQSHVRDWPTTAPPGSARLAETRFPERLWISALHHVLPPRSSRPPLSFASKQRRFQLVNATPLLLVGVDSSWSRASAGVAQAWPEPSCAPSS
jgi:hypothetical protein